VTDARALSVRGQALDRIDWLPSAAVNSSTSSYISSGMNVEFGNAERGIKELSAKGQLPHYSGVSPRIAGLKTEFASG
jgi:hypothetical protein